jgi:predicted nuclease of predicted toxin-antitoxin system
MRVLLDESLPRELKGELSAHHVQTVPEAGWSGRKNGELLQLANERFDIFVTADKSIPEQQNLTGLNLRIIVVRARSNSLGHPLPLVPGLLRFLEVIQPGQIMRLVG